MGLHNVISFFLDAMAGSDFIDNLDANSLFLVQCVIAGTIGGLEFCFPALFVDTFNTFEVYTSHRLYGATMIVNAIVVYAMQNCQDHNAKKEIIQAFLFQFGLHIIVLLRPQVWGFLTPFNKINLLCSFGLAAAYGYLLMGDKRKISTGFSTMQRAQKAEEDLKKSNEALVKQTRMLKEANAKIAKLEASDSKKR